MLPPSVQCGRAGARPARETADTQPVVGDPTTQPVVDDPVAAVLGSAAKAAGAPDSFRAIPETVKAILDEPTPSTSPPHLRTPVVSTNRRRRCYRRNG